MENELLLASKTQYNTFIRDINKFDDTLDLEAKVRHLFKRAEGQVYFKSKSPTYVLFDGRVKDYTIGGAVSKNYECADLKRLAEDLTMAYYRNNGGKQQYIPHFISTIKALNG